MMKGLYINRCRLPLYQNPEQVFPREPYIFKWVDERNTVVNLVVYTGLTAEARINAFQSLALINVCMVYALNHDALITVQTGLQ